MLWIVFYLCVTLWIIRYILKPVYNCPRCKKFMESERSEFGSLWRCKCGIEIWIVE